MEKSLSSFIEKTPPLVSNGLAKITVKLRYALSKSQNYTEDLTDL